MHTKYAPPLHTAGEIEKLAARCREERMIAVDTEFIRESTFFPVVALVQVATRDQSWLVDPLTASKEALAPLLELFTDPKVLKILHSAQSDQECLFSAFGIVATPSFDTAVGASLCGMGDSISLQRLVRETVNLELEKGHARTDWTRRPLPPQLLRYAYADVDCLVEVAEVLFKRLDSLGRRNWALELSKKFEDTKLYLPDPAAVVQRLTKNSRIDSKTFGVLTELADWREQRARAVNVPRRRIVDDDVLIDLSRTRPQDLEHLQAFRGLNKGEFRTSGDAILQAIARGLANAQAGRAVPPIRQEPASDGECRVLELVICMARAIADQNAISLKHLMSADWALEIIRARPRTVDELAALNLLSQGAVELLGRQLTDLLEGRLSLSIRDGAVEIFRVRS